MNFHLEIIFPDPKFLINSKASGKESANLENDDLQAWKITRKILKI